MIEHSVLFDKISQMANYYGWSWRADLEVVRLFHLYGVDDVSGRIWIDEPDRFP